MKRIYRHYWLARKACARFYHGGPDMPGRQFMFNTATLRATLPKSSLTGVLPRILKPPPLNFRFAACVSTAGKSKNISSMADVGSDIDPRPIHSSGSGARSRIVWVDAEMTGLDPDQHRIVEISCVITDADLNIIAEAPTLVIYQPPNVLDNMSQWCRENFSKSGLIEQVKSSMIDLPTADQQLVDFVTTYCDKKCAPLAGNSVWADRMFMAKQLPLLNEYLHYRIIDVSSVKELCKRWYPRDFSNAPKKDLKHRALADIRESIEELKYYRKNIFKPKPEGKKA